MITKILLLIVSFLVVISGCFIWDIKQDRDHKIQILKSTPLYDDWESSKSLVVGTAEEGEELKVVRIRYGKHTMYIEVERNDGSTGWIEFGETINLSNK